MKKMFVVFLGLVLLPAIAYADGFSVSKKSGDVTVKVSMENPVVGSNEIALELLGADGSPITDAKVELDYFMPSMPAMRYKVTAESRDGGYAAVLKLAMAGRWSVGVSFTRPGGEPEKITFSIDAK
ncbi:MAG TPA: hypothetical protein ENJ04_09705 [Nitrospirae bacterium]|nr:hypothetical protein [Nitrospirota bacterium]